MRFAQLEVQKGFALRDERDQHRNINMINQRFSVKKNRSFRFS